MKLSPDPNHPDYHDIFSYVNVRDQGLYLKACTWIDTETGEYECYEQPLRVVFTDELVRKSYKSECLTVSFQEDTPEWLIKDWYLKDKSVLGVKYE
jgi:hypothetical protein